MLIKKSLLLASFLFSSALVIGACADDDTITKDSTNNDQSNDLVDSDPGDNPANVVGMSYDFTYFELHVNSASQDDEVYILYQEKKDATDAEYTNELSNQHLIGSDALNYINPSLEKLQINQNLSNDEIMKQIINAFQLKEDYTSINAKVTYKNGDTEEYELENEPT